MFPTDDRITGYSQRKGKLYEKQRMLRGKLQIET